MRLFSSIIRVPIRYMDDTRQQLAMGNEDLPTEATGKVQKKELKAFYTECVSRPDHE